MKKYLLEYPTILERLKEVSPEDNGEEWFNNTCMFIESIIQTEVDIALAKAKTSESVEHKGCIKSLDETIELMNSADYKERFLAEYLQLNFRYTKLRDMINDYHAGILDFIPTCPMELLENQRAYMFSYIKCLQERAKLEKIELPSIIRY